MKAQHTERSCGTCKHFEKLITEEPCTSCNLFAGDPPLNNWEEKDPHNPDTESS